MNMKKIILIEPKASGLHIFSKFFLPRLGLPLLGAILKKAGHEVKIFCEDIKPINWEVVFESDLIGISTITSTAPGAFRLLQKIKKGNKNIPVVMGGPHVTFLPEEALEQGADYVVRGEGERTVVEFLNWLWSEESEEKKKNKIIDILGLSYKIGNKIFHNKARPFLTSRELDALPWPDFSLIDGLKNFKKKKLFKKPIIPITTSRGCPYNCSFCSVTKMWGNCYRFREASSVVEEMRYFLDRIANPHFFFYDDNFTANPNRTKNLLARLTKIKQKFSWSAQVRVDVAKDDELLELMKRSGCSMVYVGIESINPDTLKDYRKGLVVDDIIRGVERFHKAGIKIHGMFVLGGDSDTLKTIKQTVNFSIRNKIDTVQFLILVPLPGTETFKKLKEENRLIDGFSWSLYDGHHVVFEPKEMIAWQLQSAVMLQAMPKFYSFWRTLKKILFSYVNKEIIINFILFLCASLLLKKWRNQNKEFLKNLKKMILKPAFK